MIDTLPGRFGGGNRVPGFKHLDTVTGELWITPPKCASSSFRQLAADTPDRFTDWLGQPYDSATVVVQHPWQRIVDGFADVELTTEYLHQKREAMHIHAMPMWFFVRGHRDVRVVNRKDLDALWNTYTTHPLPHENVSPQPKRLWDSLDIDWERLRPLYPMEFELCPE